MTSLTSVCRLLLAGFIAGTCLSLSGEAGATCTWSGSAWARLGAAVQSPPGSVVVDLDADGDLDRLAVDHALTSRTIWRDDHGGHALLQIRESDDQTTAVHTGLVPSPSDDSDSSDPSARPESRAGPSLAQPAGGVLAVTAVTPRSRPFSSSTPRAPPVALHLA